MSLQARYTILRKIADGGTAEIFLATQKGVHGFEKPVVLKRIFSAYYADPQFRDMLVNEAHIAMSLNHSNIVQVLDLGEDEGQYILAMELVDGWTLDAVMRRVRGARSTIRPALALYITAEVCRALAYAHAKTGPDGNVLGLVHRDISPQNVLLSEQGEVKLTDFGIAIVGNKPEGVGPGGDKVIKGKIAYMSPEQASGGPMDARSDLFSVGTILYVMACGRYPFDAPTDLGVLLLVKSDEYVPPEVARPGINPELARILKRAMAKNLADRYQRADDMLLDVEQVMRSQFVAVGQTELKRWLADLSVRDGVPVLSKAPAMASSAQSGRIVGARDDASSTQTTQTTTPRMPPPPSAAARSVTTVQRPMPVPPPAALSVGRRSTAMPSVGSGPLQRPPTPVEPSQTAATRELPVLEPAAVTPAPTPRGSAIPQPMATGTSGPIAEATAPVAADPVAAFRAARRTSASMPALTTPPLGSVVASGGSADSSRITTDTPNDPNAPASPSAAGGDSSSRPTRLSRPVLTLKRPTTGSHPVIVTPPPVSAEVIAPPPVSPDILAAINAPTKTTPFLSLLPDTTAPKTEPATASNGPVAPSDRAEGSGRGKLPIAWIGGGIVGLIALVASIKTCSSGPAKDAAKPPVVAIKESAPAPVVQAPPAPQIVPVPAPSVTPTPASTTDAAAAVAVVDATLATADAAGALATVPDKANAQVNVDAAAPTSVATLAPKPATIIEKAPDTAGGAPPVPAPEATKLDSDPFAPKSETKSETKSDEKSDEDPASQKPQASINLNSVPPGARVTSAHHAYGTTPVMVRLRAGGVYALTFAHDGYRPLTKRISVPTEEDQDITVTLRKAPPPPPPPPPPMKAAPAAPAAPPPPPAEKAPEGSWWQRMFKRNH